MRITGWSMFTSDRTYCSSYNYLWEPSFDHMHLNVFMIKHLCVPFHECWDNNCVVIRVYCVGSICKRASLSSDTIFILIVAILYRGVTPDHMLYLTEHSSVNIPHDVISMETLKRHSGPAVWTATCVSVTHNLNSFCWFHDFVLVNGMVVHYQQLDTCCEVRHNLLHFSPFVYVCLISCCLYGTNNFLKSTQ